MKKNIALMLTLCMVLTNIVPAYADEVTAHEEPVIQQEVSDIEISEIITDFETNEAASDGVSYKDETILENIEEATPANANYIEQDETPEDTDMDAFEEATPANAKYTDEKFICETVVDGIKITLTADPGVFPEEAELWAEKIEDEATEEVIEEAVEKERDNNVNVALSYKFDIKMFVNGEEVQPDTSKGSVKVTFTLTEELSKCLDANAYHLKEEADGELTAENLGAEVKTVEEASSEETVKETVDTSKLMNTVGTDEDGVIEDDVTKKVTKLEAETDGFSYYVVEFTYNELTYELPGDSSVKLSAILETFKLEGTVTAAEVSNSELFTVTEDADEMDWTVTALQAFNTTEKLTVTLDNAQYDISVTDDSSSEELYYKIDKDNNVLYISSEYKDEGYESFDSSQIPPWQPLEVKSGINSVIIENEIHPSSMCKWFSGCTGLRSVTGLSCVVVPENIAEMFSDCTSLETFDLSNFNTSNVTNMSGMFKGCSGLKTIYVQNFNTEKVLSSDDMFTDCINLCGGNGTVYNLDETEKKYARIDKHDQSGYFTYGGSDQTTAYFVSKGQIVCTRTVRGGDGITVPGFAREGCDGWYIGKEIKYLPGDEFKTSAGESSYTLYDEWIQEKIDWQIIFDDQERYRKYSESSGTVSFTPAYVTSGYADITYRIDNSTDYFYITDPCKAEIMISRDTPAGTYALHISATAAEDDLHKKTSKTINYKLIVYENAQTEITLDHGMHGTGGYTSAVAEIGKAMPVIKPPTANTGYVFDGYYDAESGGTKYYNAEGTSARVWDKDTKSYTLLAQWMPESYTITYDLAGGTVSGSNPGTYTIESDSITLINPTKDGYIFTGWTGTGLDSPAMNVTIPAGSTGDRSYTATWERCYEIEIHSNNTEYGTVSAAAVSNLPYGTTITASENILTVGSRDVTATASENTDKYSYSFKEWSGIPAGGTVTADIAITAVFERIAQKYTVTFEGNFEGSEYSESITETYGSKYIIPTEEPKRTGYTFLGWYTNSTGGTKITSDSVVDITSDTSLYAQWKKNSSRGGGTSDSSSKPAFTGTWGNPVTGIWTRDTDGVWHFRTNAPFVSTWGYIVNPYAQAGQNQADWFWFDDNGRMLTGWQYINGHWYYLNPSKDGTLGSCLIGPGRTPDGYEIDASGAWTGR